MNGFNNLNNLNTLNYSPSRYNDVIYRTEASASLDLNFARNKSLIDSISGNNLVTFTRASSGTYVGDDGLIKTATTNLLLRSEEFDNASWFAINTTTAADTALSPFGNMTADTINFNSISANRYQSVTTKASTTYTFSIWMRSVSGTFELKLARTNGLTWASATVSSPITLTTNWQRYSLTFTTDATDTTSDVIIGDEALTSYNLPATGSIYAWGAQVEESPTMGEYIPTTTTINSAPRFDHNPVTKESLGLLVEEQRTNLLNYSEDVSLWSSPFNATLTVNSISAPDGALTADQLLETTATNLHTCDGTAFTFVTSTVYTYSVFVKPIGDRNFEIAFPVTVFTARFARFTLSGAGSVQGTDSGVTGSIQAYANGWYRCVATSTCASGAGSRVGNFINNASNARSYLGDTSKGIYIWGAQLEAGAFPTSYIPTTSATVTRSADVASITGTNFSSWYNQSEGTFVSESSSFDTSGFPRIFAASDGTTNNQIRNSVNPGTLFSTFIVVTGGVSQAGIVIAYLVNTSYKRATAYKANDFVFVQNSGFPFTDTSGTVPTVDRLNIGSNESSLAQINGYIRRIAYFPTRLSNTTLQNITK